MRFHPCDKHGNLDPGWPGWINVPEESPFPHETRYYSALDVIRRRMEICYDLKKSGYDYALAEYEPDKTKLIPIYKLEDTQTPN